MRSEFKPRQQRHRVARAVIGFALAISALMAGLPATEAQTTSGTLYGVVFEPSGTPVEGALVSAINEVNGNTRSTVTFADGLYRIPFLPPGRYSIRAAKTGFTDSQITGFPIPLNSTTNLVPPITLGTPGGSATVPRLISTRSATEGERRASLVNTNDPTRRANFTREQVTALPLGGTTGVRTFDELALLAAGVSAAPYVPGVRGPGVGFGIGTSGQFSVNGSRARSNNFTVDGSDNNDPDVGVRRQGFIALVPQSIESVQEFQLSTLVWDTELGRNVGSQVNAVSRGGGNALDGTIFGMVTDRRLNARNFFDYEGGPSRNENPYTRVQAGLAVGGPIVKDSSQFFASFERIGLHASEEQHFSTPRAFERRFLGLDRFGVIHSEAVPAAINYATDDGATPIGSAVLSIYPLPNSPGGPYGANTFTEILPASGNGHVFSLKVTHEFNRKNDLSVRYNLTDDDRELPSVNRSIRSTLGSESQTQNLSVILDTSFGPRLFNQARFSYGYTRLAFPEYPTSPLLIGGESTSNVRFFTEGGGAGDPVTLKAGTGLLGQLIVEPFSPVGVDVGTFPQGRDSGTFQVADSVSWTLGGHSLKFGADVRYVRLNSFLDRNYRPLVVYNNGIRVDVAPDRENATRIDFLPGVQLAAVGLPSSIFQSLTNGTPDSSASLRFWEVNGFVNDSWRIRPNFSLDVGIRYEVNTVPRDATGRIERALSLQGITPAGTSPLDSAGRSDAFSRALDWYRRVVGERDRIYDPDLNNFGPHIGFAWDPFSNGHTAVRGGYGIAFDAILGSVVSQSRNVFPTEIPINIAPSFLPFISLGLPLPIVLSGEVDGYSFSVIKPGTLNQLGGAQGDYVAIVGEIIQRSIGTGGIASTIPVRDLATPYVQQWHLSVEREFLSDYLLTVAYVGTKGTKLTRLVTPNNGASITPAIPVLRRRDQLPLILFSQQFNDLAPTRPVTRFLGAYQVFENSAASNYHALQIEARKRMSSGVAFTAAYTWSHALDDVSDVFPIAGAPVLPQDSSRLDLERASASFDSRHRFAGSLIWDLPGQADGPGGFLIGDWQVAAMFQGATGQPFTLNIPFDANFDGNLTDRPATTNGLTFVDRHGPVRVVVTPGTNAVIFLGDGAVGRNTARGDGFVAFDLALSKAFALGDTQRLQFRTEVFNILNRANFGLPVRFIGNPGFGSAVDTIAPARVIQLGLKYSF